MFNGRPWALIIIFTLNFIKWNKGAQVNHEQIKCIFACLTQLNYWNTINQPYPHLLVSTLCFNCHSIAIFCKTPFTLHSKDFDKLFFFKKTSSTIINWFSLFLSAVFRWSTSSCKKLDKWTSDIKVYLYLRFYVFFSLLPFFDICLMFLFDIGTKKK